MEMSADVLTYLRRLEKQGEDYISRTAEEARKEIEQLRAEAAGFHMGYRTKCDEETKAQAVKIEQLAAALDELIACDDLQTKTNKARGEGDDYEATSLEDEYMARDPLAWEVARRLRGKG
jgi:hypothetical protein